MNSQANSCMLRCLSGLFFNTNNVNLNWVLNDIHMLYSCSKMLFWNHISAKKDAPLCHIHGPVMAAPHPNYLSKLGVYTPVLAHMRCTIQHLTSRNSTGLKVVIEIGAVPLEYTISAPTVLNNISPKPVWINRNCAAARLLCINMERQQPFRLSVQGQPHSLLIT